MMNDERITEASRKLIDMFSCQDFPPALSRTIINRMQGDGRPSDKWSITNQIIMMLSGTDDARGFRQWQQVKRSVKKGARAIYIFAPIITRMTEKKIDLSAGYEISEDKSILKGFKLVPVFRCEDTEGEALPIPDYSPPVLPPLTDVAEFLGCTVSYKPFNHSAYGSFNPSGEISLYSHDVDVFFHELAHLAHHKIKGLKPGQDADQELVAEMSGCILCELYGYKGYQYQGFHYMQSYSGCDPVKTIQNIGALLNEVELVVKFILKVEESLVASA
jgi:hypothetical protein